MNFMILEPMSPQPLPGEVGYYLLLISIIVIVIGNSLLTVFTVYFCVDKEVNSFLFRQLGRVKQIKYWGMGQLTNDKYQVIHSPSPQVSRSEKTSVVLSPSNTSSPALLLRGEGSTQYIFSVRHPSPLRRGAGGEVTLASTQPNLKDQT